MMVYVVQYRDSPRVIAHKFGIRVHDLIRANPHKFLAVVGGQHTWKHLVPGERINVPMTGGYVGQDPAVDAIQALTSAGSPCDQANVGLVCAAQAALGQEQDGKWGHDTAAAAQSRVPGAPAGCSPRPAWWAPHGQTNCGAGGAPIPAAAPAAGGNLRAIAAAALAALSTDPNYCVSVSQPGSAVNTAVHNFKAAWNSANPGNPVPIGTGNYEPSVAVALTNVLGGATVPPGCGAGAPLPGMPPTPAAGPAGPAGPPGMPGVPGLPAPPPGAPAAGGGAVAPGGLVAPTQKHKITTGALIAGGIGAAALVGVVAFAAAGGRKTTTRTSRTTVIRKPRKTTRRKSARKSAPRRRR